MKNDFPGGFIDNSSCFTLCAKESCIMFNINPTESDNDSISDDSLEVSDIVTNDTTETVLDAPDKDKISCALCTSRNKGMEA